MSNNTKLILTNGKPSRQTDQAEAKDRFGRTLAERTIYLSPEQAESLNLQIQLYGDTSPFFRDWDSAWQYILGRGFAEVTRQRKVKEKQQRTKENTIQGFARLLADNPDFVTNPAKVAELIAAIAKNRNGGQRG